MLPVFHHHHLLLVLFRSFVPTTDGQGVTGLGIVDDAGKLVGEISVRDLRGMGWDAAGFWRLYGTIRAFKAWEGKMTPRVGLVTVHTFDTLEFLLQSVRVTGTALAALLVVDLCCANRDVRAVSH